MIDFIKRLFEDKRIRFLFVGGINTFVGYSVFVICILIGFHYAIAQIISTIIGVTNSYFWNKYFTFQQKRKSKSEVVRFISVYAVSYVINLSLLYIMIDRLAISEYLAGLLGLAVTTLISYFGHNKFSFKGE